MHGFQIPNRRNSTRSPDATASITSARNPSTTACTSGFDMPIGERGESLSGGQRQGVAIARAVLLDPPVLLLDEPTSSMDFTSESQFKESLRRFMQHKTMVIVTHRLSLIDLAERMIVIDDGKVVTDGPRQQVVESLQAGRVGRAT